MTPFRMCQYRRNFSAKNFRRYWAQIFFENQNTRHKISQSHWLILTEIRLVDKLCINIEYNYKILSNVMFLKKLRNEKIYFGIDQS